MKANYELHTGINGSGNTVYLVVAVDDKGNWKFTHTFTNEKEAKNWMKWA